MKIIHLITTFSPGGAERFVVDLCNEQQRQGHTVSILCTHDTSIGENSHYESDVNDGIEIIKLNCRKLSFVVLCKIVHCIKTSNVDVVHAHTFPVLLYLPALFTKKKIVWTIHNVATRYLSSKLDRFFVGLFCKRNRIFPVTISDVCHRSFMELCGACPDKVIYNGRSTIEFTEHKQNVIDYINSLKNNEKTPVFIHVARYSEAKNQDLLFAAFKKLYADGLDFCLIVIGAGFPEEIKSQAELCPNIHILGTKKNVGDYLYASNYFILSSVFEGLPISLLEAMSIGCIPISTPAGGVADVIKNGITGYLSSSHFLDDFVNTVKRALNDNSITQQSIIDDYNQKYKMEVCAKLYLDYYRDIISNH